MTKTRTTTLAALLLLAAGSAHAAEAVTESGQAAGIAAAEPALDVSTEATAETVMEPPAPLAPLSTAFTPGEETIYKITALGMTAGKARITVGHNTPKDGMNAWPVVVQARTDSIFDKVYTVRDRFVTWWHPSTGRVIGADFFADEGGKRHRSMSKLDHESGSAEVLRIRDWKGGERSRRTYEMTPGAYDIAGAIMALRGRSLEPGSVHEIDVFTGKKVFKLRCIVDKIEKVKTGAGTFEAVSTRIQLGFDGQFASKRDVRAWFSRDERQLPLRFEAEFTLGTIVADLIETKRGITLQAAAGATP